LHDMFAVPFEEIAPIVGRSPEAARQLASRARRRVSGAPVPDADLSKQREVVEAFAAASREGDFDALGALLDPDVVFRIDRGLARRAAGVPRAALRGAINVATQVWRGRARFAPFVRPALVNGAVGAIFAPEGQPVSVVGITVTGGKIAEIDVFA